jgi:hypothetical protein
VLGVSHCKPDSPPAATVKDPTGCNSRTAIQTEKGMGRAISAGVVCKGVALLVWAVVVGDVWSESLSRENRPKDFGVVSLTGVRTNQKLRSRHQTAEQVQKDAIYRVRETRTHEQARALFLFRT